MACSFEQWYPKFRSLRSTFASAYILLDARFITYLRKDGIRLPKAPVALVDLKPSDPRRLDAVDVYEQNFRLQTLDFSFTELKDEDFKLSSDAFVLSMPNSEAEFSLEQRKIKDFKLTQDFEFIPNATPEFYFDRDGTSKILKETKDSFLHC